MSNGKLTSVSARGKKVAISKLREIVKVASLGQINKIENDCAGKYKKECSREQRKINEHERAREKGSSFKIARNRTSSIIRPNI